MFFLTPAMPHARCSAKSLTLLLLLLRWCLLLCAENSTKDCTVYIQPKQDNITNIHTTALIRSAMFFPRACNAPCTVLSQIPHAVAVAAALLLAALRRKLSEGLHRPSTTKAGKYNKYSHGNG
jgi:hypothetical protein